MSRLSRLDRVASGLILSCGALVALVIFLGGRAGVRIKTDLPEDGLIGPMQKVELTFSESVDAGLAEQLFHVDPDVTGTFNWVDSQTLEFTPSQPFKLGTVYRLMVLPGVVGKNGRQVKKELTWGVRVRQPLMAYLNTQDDQSSIWVMDLNHNAPRQLTDPSVRVIGFDAARNGEFIVFYSVNQQGGVDLWRVSRSGGDASVLLDCGRDRCTTPAISPDGTRVAYSREAAGPGPDLPYGSPRVWVVDLQSGQDNPVYEDQQILGYHPSWSPDGTLLASYDGIADELRLFNVTNGQQLRFASNTGGPVTWSPDGSKFLFTNVTQGDAGLRTVVRMADLKLGKAETLIGDRDEFDYAYYSLAWSPSDDSVLLGMRADKENPADIFWLFNPGRLDGIVIASQENYAYNSPQWDVWGNSLVFQQFKLKGPYKPEIGLWQPGFKEPQTIAEGLIPQWLP